MKTYTLEEVKDKFIGAEGTLERELYEQELRLDLLGEAIRKARNKRNLTQAQLGELVGVKKAQISKLENNLTNARFDTLIRVFKALDANLKFTVELEDELIQLSE